MNIHERFDEVRPKAAQAFWDAFAARGFGPDDLTECPDDVPSVLFWQNAKKEAFAACDRVAARLLNLPTPATE